MKRIGTVKELVRHPVKSLRGESVAQSLVSPLGLVGDRTHAFKQKDKPEHYLTIQEFPGLLRYQGQFITAPTSATEYPAVHVTTPDGTVYPWGDPELEREIAAASGFDVIAETLRYDQGSSNYEDPILLTTDASLRDMEAKWGHSLDNRRFRSNIVIALDEDAPYAEREWRGCQLQIGDVVLGYGGGCLRCFYVNVDPDSAAVDASLLKTVVQQTEGVFGLYVTVEATGTIAVGDEVFLHVNKI